MGGYGTALCFINPSNREMNINLQIQKKVEEIKKVKMELQQ